ncbi:hypothetical protein ACFLWU_07015, partial [Chloroflexota bacterium]
ERNQRKAGGVLRNLTHWTILPDGWEYPPETLRATVDEYNACCDDDTMGFSTRNEGIWKLCALLRSTPLNVSRDF